MADVQAVENPDDTATAELIDLLVSDRPDEQAKGESLLAAQRSSLIAGQLQRILSPDASTSGKAAYVLGILISPWLRGVEASHRFTGGTSIQSLRRPVDKVPQLAEAPVIRQCLQTAIAAVFDSITDESERNYPKDEALRALCETLGEVANDDTMIWTINRLPQIKSPTLAAPLIKLAESCLNLPETFELGGMCGNSTREEVEEFHHDQAARFAEARAKLAATWQEFRPLGTKERIAFAIKTWRERLLPTPESRGFYHASSSDWLSLIEPLVRLGAPAVEALRAQQRLETNREMKGIWEAVIAAITGREDAELVDTLFKGEPELACVIVAATASKGWLPELEEIQLRTSIDEAGKASAAIAISHGSEGIPALKKAAETNPDNFYAKCYLDELQARAKKGSPKGMHRYSLP